MSACQEPSNDRRKNEYHPDHVRVRNVAWKEASGTTATRAGTFNDHLLEHVGAVLDRIAPLTRVFVFLVDEYAHVNGSPLSTGSGDPLPVCRTVLVQLPLLFPVCH